MDPRRCQLFKEAGNRQTGEVHEYASSASAREAREGLTRINATYSGSSGILKNACALKIALEMTPDL